MMINIKDNFPSSLRKQQVYRNVSPSPAENESQENFMISPVWSWHSEIDWG